MALQINSEGNDEEVHVNNKQKARGISVDDKRGFAIVFGATLINFVCDGILFSFLLMHAELLRDFAEEDNDEKCWIFDLTYTLCSSAGLIASFFIRRYGCRVVTIVASVVCAISLFVSSFASNILTLFLSVGVLFNLFLPAIFIASIVTVTKYFEKYRALATGISISSTSTFVVIPLFEFLKQQFRWRGIFMVWSGAMLVCALGGFLFLPMSLTNPQNNSPQRSKTSLCHGIVSQNLSILKDPIFIVFSVFNFAVFMGYYVPYVLFDKLGSEVGISGEPLFLMMEIVNTLSRIIMGYICDKPWVNRRRMLIISLGIGSSVTIAMAVFCFNYGMFIIYLILFEIMSGLYATLQSVILANLIGLETIEIAFGIVLFFLNVAKFFGTQIVEFISEHYSYIVGLWFIGILIAFGGLTLSTIPILENKIRKGQLQYEVEHRGESIML